MTRSRTNMTHHIGLSIEMFRLEACGIIYVTWPKPEGFVDVNATWMHKVPFFDSSFSTDLSDAGHGTRGRSKGGNQIEVLQAS